MAAGETLRLSISKCMSPTSVVENGTVTYTFYLQNSGNTATAAADYVIVTDTFDPILSGLTVTLDGAPLTLGTDYTYDTATGAFATTAGTITVPAATAVQDAETGLWRITPRRDQAGHHRHGVNSNLCGAPAVAPPPIPLSPSPVSKRRPPALGSLPVFHILQDLPNGFLHLPHFFLELPGRYPYRPVPQYDDLLQSIRGRHPHPVLLGQRVGHFSIYISAVSASLVYTTLMPWCRSMLPGLPFTL